MVMFKTYCTFEVSLVPCIVLTRLAGTMEMKHELFDPRHTCVEDYVEPVACFDSCFSPLEESAKDKKTIEHAFDVNDETSQLSCLRIHRSYILRYHMCVN